MKRREFIKLFGGPAAAWPFAGEAGTTGAGAACMNAVVNALRSAGVVHFDMPATPGRLWSAVQQASAVLR